MHSTIRGAALALLAAVPLRGVAQSSTPNWPAPGQLVREGVELHDKNDFAGAIAKYQAVSPNDSTYAMAQSELALSLQSAGKSEEAVAAARRALALNPDEPQTYNNLADALAATKQLDAALAMYQQGLKRFPYSQNLYYNLGVAQYLASQTHASGALVNLQRSMELRPLHPNSHRILGLLSAEQGHTSHALLGLLSFLVLAQVDETHKAVLVQAERVSLGVPIVEEKDKVKPVASNTAFAELDQLLESKIALQDAYVSKVKFTAAVVKQAQLLVEKFPVDGPADDFWVRAYGPMIKVLRQPDQLPTFIYVALQSADDPKAAQWLKANKPKVEKLYAALVPALLTLREQQLVEGGTPGQRQQAWFSDEHALIGLGAGHKDEKGTFLATSTWNDISTQGAIETQGRYTAAGKRTGFWKVLRPDGSTEKTVTYDDKGQREGKAQEFHTNGQPSMELIYHLDKIEGPLTLFNECGERTEIRNFRAGDLEGAYSTFYAGGQPRYRATLRADKIEGTEEQLYPDGTPEYSYTYVGGKKQGPFSVYYADKTLERKGIYDQNELHGPYTDYHANGQIDGTGTYNHGKHVGVWRTYFSNGKLSVERSYDEAGELHGVYHDYDEQGHLYADTEYSHGRTVALRYFDAKDKLVLDQPIKKSRIAVRSLRPDGAVNGSGSYTDGQMTGEWKWFFRDGRVREVSTCSPKGYKTGVSETYWQNGKLRQRQTFDADGNLNGRYERFHPNGQPAQRGYYYQGQQHGPWQDYYATGQMSGEVYYHKGSSNGIMRSYTPGGKLTQERQLAFGVLRRITAFDSVGNVMSINELKPATKELKFLYPSGKTYYQAAMRCGMGEGPARWLRPDGSVESSFSLLNDQRHGLYQATYPNGKPELVGNNVAGQRQGEWKTYHPNGQVQAQGLYHAGEQDGEWSYFFPDGKLALMQTYLGGQLHGPSRRYNPAGEMVLDKIFEYGDMLSYRGPGADQAPYQALPTDLSGSVRTTFANGKPAAEETVTHNIPTGSFTYYYATGQVFRREAYGTDGLRTGKLESFWPSGKPLDQESYLHGELHGRCRYFRPDGTLEREESYLSGERSGPTTYYDAAGKPLRTEQYWNTMIYDKK